MIHPGNNFTFSVQTLVKTERNSLVATFLAKNDSLSENSPEKRRHIPEFYRSITRHPSLARNSLLSVLLWSFAEFFCQIVKQNGSCRRHTSGKLFAINSLCKMDINSLISCSKMPQSLTNDDLFDAELGEESDGGQNGDLSEEGNVSKSQEHDWLHEQHENNSGGEAANSGSNEETRNEKKENEAKNKVNLSLSLINIT